MDLLSSDNEIPISVQHKMMYKHSENASNFKPIILIEKEFVAGCNSEDIDSDYNNNYISSPNYKVSLLHNNNT